MDMVILQGVLARKEDLRASASGNFYLFNAVKVEKEWKGKKYTKYINFKSFGEVAEKIAVNASSKMKFIGSLNTVKNEKTGYWELEVVVNSVEVLDDYLPPAHDLNDGAKEVSLDDLPF